MQEIGVSFPATPRLWGRLLQRVDNNIGKWNDNVFQASLSLLRGIGCKFTSGCCRNACFGDTLASRVQMCGKSNVQVLSS